MAQSRPGTREGKIRELVALRLQHLRARHPDGPKTQAWLAERLSSSKGEVVRLEGGKKPVTIELVEQLAHAFNMPALEFLCEGSDPIWPLPERGAITAAYREKYLREVDRQHALLRERYGADFTADILGNIDAARASMTKLSSELEDLKYRMVMITPDPRVWRPEEK